MCDGSGKPWKQLIENPFTEVLGDLAFPLPAFGQGDGMEAAIIRIAWLWQEGFAPEEQEEGAQVMYLGCTVPGGEQFGVDAGDVRQRAEIELQELLRTRARTLPVQAPQPAIGQDAPAHGAIGSDLGAAEVTQDLVGRCARIHRIAAIAAIQGSQPALGFQDQGAVAVATVASRFRSGRALAVGIGEEQEVRHVQPAGGICGGLPQLLGPAERRHHLEDDFVFGLGLVEASTGIEPAKDADDGFAETDESVLGLHPAPGLANAFCEKVTRKKQSIHGLWRAA